jgi:hypothetical protein
MAKERQERFALNRKFIPGMENLDSIGGRLYLGDSYFGGNPSLLNLSGIYNLSKIGGSLEINDNSTLTSLSGMEDLASIGGGLWISNNDALTSLAGLENIHAGSITDLLISDNYSLSTCEVQSICDYLANPNGDIWISGNAPGCNSQEEVELACETVGVGQSAVGSWRPVPESEANRGSAVMIYPNPASSLITVETDNLLTNCTFAIYNLQGQELLRQRITQATTVLDISRLPSGMYFYHLTPHASRLTASC